MPIWENRSVPLVSRGKLMHPNVIRATVEERVLQAFLCCPAFRAIKPARFEPRQLAFVRA